MGFSKKPKVRIFLKICTWVVVISFLYENVVWAQGQSSPQSIVHSPQLMMPAIDTSSVNLNIPSGLGKVTESYKGTNGKTILHIIDTHADYNVQQNYSKILDEIINQCNNQSQKVLLAIEGAEGAINPALLRALPSEEVKRGICEHFLKKGYLTGAEYFSVFTNSNNFIFWGVDDKELYLKNYQLFKDVQGFRDRMGEFVKGTREVLDRLEPKLLNEEQLSFLTSLKQYHSHKLPITEYCKLLRPYMGEVSEFSNIITLLKAIQLDSRIDYERIENERADLIKELKNRLVKEDLEKLIEKSLLFKSGRINSLEYYNYLLGLCYATSSVPPMRANPEGVKPAQAGTGLLRRPSEEGAPRNDGLYENLHLYRDLLNLYSNINHKQLIQEVHILENEVRGLLFNGNPGELANLQYNLMILKNLVDLELTREQWDYYTGHRGEFIPQNIYEQTKKLTYGSERLPTPPEDGVEMSTLEDYFRTVLDRDTVILKNTISKMDEEGIKTAILITGGFHTEGITEKLKEENASYIVVSPKGSGNEYDSPYLSVMMNEFTPYERLVTQMGKRLIANIAFAKIPLIPGRSEAIFNKGILSSIVRRLMDAEKPNREIVESLYKEIEAGLDENAQKIFDSVKNSIKIDYENIGRKNGKFYVPYTLTFKGRDGEDREEKLAIWVLGKGEDIEDIILDERYLDTVPELRYVITLQETFELQKKVDSIVALGDSLARIKRGINILSKLLGESVILEIWDDTQKRNSLIDKLANVNTKLPDKIELPDKPKGVEEFKKDPAGFVKNLVSKKEPKMTHIDHELIIDNFIKLAGKKGRIEILNKDSEPVKEMREYLKAMGFGLENLLDNLVKNGGVKLVYVEKEQELPKYYGNPIRGHAGNKGIYVFLKCDEYMAISSQIRGIDYIESVYRRNGEEFDITAKLIYEFFERLGKDREYASAIEEDFKNWRKTKTIAPNVFEMLKKDGKLQAPPTDVVKPRGEDGRFKEKPGGSTGDVLKVIVANPELRDEDGFTVSEYMQYENRVSESIIRKDLNELFDRGYLDRKDWQKPYRYSLTEDGKEKVSVYVLEKVLKVIAANPELGYDLKFATKDKGGNTIIDSRDIDILMEQGYIKEVGLFSEAYGLMSKGQEEIETIKSSAIEEVDPGAITSSLMGTLESAPLPVLEELLFKGPQHYIGRSIKVVKYGQLGTDLVLDKTLEDLDEDVDEIFGILKGINSIVPLDDILNEVILSKYSLKIAIINTLVERGTPEAFDVLIRFLDKNIDTRSVGGKIGRDLFWGLVGYAVDTAIKIGVDIIKEREDEIPTAEEVAEDAAVSGAKSVIKGAIQRFLSSDTGLKKEVIRVLAENKVKTAEPTLIKSLQDRSVKKEAASALRRINPRIDLSRHGYTLKSIIFFFTLAFGTLGLGFIEKLFAATEGVATKLSWMEYLAQLWHSPPTALIVGICVLAAILLSILTIYLKRRWFEPRIEPPQAPPTSAKEKRISSPDKKKGIRINLLRRISSPDKKKGIRMSGEQLINCAATLGFTGFTLLFRYICSIPIEHPLYKFILIGCSVLCGLATVYLGYATLILLRAAIEAWIEKGIRLSKDVYANCLAPVVSALATFLFISFISLDDPSKVRHSAKVFFVLYGLLTFFFGLFTGLSIKEEQKENGQDPDNHKISNSASSPVKQSGPKEILRKVFFKKRGPQDITRRIISSMKELINVSLANISRIEKKAKRRKLSSDEEKTLNMFWDNIARAASVFASLGYDSKEIERLIRMVFSSGATYAKAEAILALADINYLKAAYLTRVWIREVRICCPSKVIEVLARVKNRAALPIIKGFLDEHKFFDDYSEGAYGAVTFGNPELIPDLKRALDRIEAHFVSVDKNQAPSYRLSNPENWEGALIEYTHNQLDILWAIASLGDRDFALPKLRELFKFHSYKAGRGSCDITFLYGLHTRIAEILFNLGDHEYIVPRLWYSYEEIASIEEKNYKDYFAMHKFAELLARAKDPHASEVIEGLWQTAVERGGTKYHWVSLLDAVVALPLRSAAEQIVTWLKERAYFYGEELTDEREVARALLRLGHEFGIKYFSDDLRSPLRGESYKESAAFRLDAAEALIKNSGIERSRSASSPVENNSTGFNTTIEKRWPIQGAGDVEADEHIDEDPMHCPSRMKMSLLNKGSILVIGGEAGTQEILFALRGYAPVVGVELYSPLVNKARARRKVMETPDVASEDMFERDNQFSQDLGWPLYYYKYNYYDAYRAFRAGSSSNYWIDLYPYSASEIRKAAQNLYFVPGMFGEPDKQTSYNKLVDNVEELIAKNFERFDNIVTANAYKYIEPISLLRGANQRLKKGGRLIIISTDYGGSARGSLEYSFIVLNKLDLGKIKSMWGDLSLVFKSLFPAHIVDFMELAQASGFRLAEKILDEEDSAEYYSFVKENDFDTEQITKLFAKSPEVDWANLVPVIQMAFKAYTHRLQEVTQLINEKSNYWARDCKEKIAPIMDALKAMLGKGFKDDEDVNTYLKTSYNIEKIIHYYLHSFSNIKWFFIILESIPQEGEPVLVRARIYEQLKLFTLARREYEKYIIESTQPITDKSREVKEKVGALKAAYDLSMQKDLFYQELVKAEDYKGLARNYGQLTQQIEDFYRISSLKGRSSVLEYWIGVDLNDYLRDILGDIRDIRNPEEEVNRFKEGIIFAYSVFRDIQRIYWDEKAKIRAKKDRDIKDEAAKALREIDPDINLSSRGHKLKSFLPFIFIGALSTVLGLGFIEKLFAATKNVSTQLSWMEYLAQLWHSPPAAFMISFSVLAAISLSILTIYLKRRWFEPRIEQKRTIPLKQPQKTSEKSVVKKVALTVKELIIATLVVLHLVNSTVSPPQKPESRIPSDKIPEQGLVISNYSPESPLWTDVEEGQIVFSRYRKLFPSVVQFLKFYGGQKEEYQKLREIAQFMEEGKVEIRIVDDPSIRYSIQKDEFSRTIRLARRHLDFLMRVGNYKVTVAFIAGLVAETMGKSQEEIEEMQTLIAGKSIINKNRYLDSKDLFYLKRKILANESEEKANWRTLTQADYNLILSDLLYRGRIMSAIKFAKYLKKEFGHWGDISQGEAARILEEFARFCEQKNAQINIYLPEELEKQLKAQDEAKRRELLQTKEYKIERRYVFSPKYIADKAFEGRYTGWVYEVGSQDEVLFGGKVAHTGELYNFAPYIVGLPNFFATPHAFKTMYKSNAKEVLAQRIEQVKAAIDELKRSNIYAEFMSLTISETVDDLLDKYPDDSPQRKGLSRLFEELEYLGVSLREKTPLNIGQQLDEIKKSLDNSLAKMEELGTDNLYAYLLKMSAATEEKIHSLHKRLSNPNISVKQEAKLKAEEFRTIDEACRSMIHISRIARVPEDIAKDIKTQLKTLEKRLNLALMPKMRGEIFTHLDSIKNSLNQTLVLPMIEEDTSAPYYKYLMEIKSNLESKLGTLKLKSNSKLTPQQRYILEKEAFELMIESWRALINISLIENIPGNIRGRIHEEFIRPLEGKTGIKAQDLILAIRSSAAGEDSEEASFAGRQDTHLFCVARPTAEDPEGLNSFINHWSLVNASLFNERAISYRINNDMPAFSEDTSISILFQQMFMSEHSFVAFTIDQSTGAPKIGFTVTEGQGERLVSGAEAGSTLHIRARVRPDSSLDIQIIKRLRGNRQYCLKEAPDSKSAVRTAIDERDRREFALTDNELLKDSSWVLNRLEEFYGIPLDTEGAWRMKRTPRGNASYLHDKKAKILRDHRGQPIPDRVFILTQARPETVASQRNPEFIRIRYSKIPDTAYQEAVKQGKVLNIGEVAAATMGVAKGVVVWIRQKSPDEYAKVNKNTVMVCIQSDPDMNEAMKASSGIVAQRGGENSHTMIVAKEYKIIAISGIEKDLNTILWPGMKITIDANRKKILLGHEHPTEEVDEDIDIAEFEKLSGEDWFDKGKKVGTIDYSTAAAEDHMPLGKCKSFYGTGLDRLEGVLAEIGIYPETLLAYDNYLKAYQPRRLPFGVDRLRRLFVLLRAKGPILDPDDYQDREYLAKIEKATEGYNSAKEFYIDRLSEYIQSVCDTNTPDFETVKIIYQGIEDKDLRLKVKEIVDENFQQGFGYWEYTEKLKDLLNQYTSEHKDEVIAEDISRIKHVIALLEQCTYIRMDDKKSDEYEGIIGAPRFIKKERNPMAGWRGIRIMLDNPLTTAWQMEALRRVAQRRRNKLGIFIPIVRNPQEVRKWQHIMKKKGLTKKLVKLGIMTELPINTFELDKFLLPIGEFMRYIIDTLIHASFKPFRRWAYNYVRANCIDFISTGGNDLRQYTAALDRNTSCKPMQDSVNVYEPSILRSYSLLATSVLKFMDKYKRVASELGLKPIKIGIGSCGNDPSIRGQEDLAAMMYEFGYDSISLTIDAFMKVARNVVSAKRTPEHEIAFQNAHNFDFEINPKAKVKKIDYVYVDIGKIRLDAFDGYHFRLFYDFDNKFKTLVSKEQELSEQKELLGSSLEQKEKELLDASGESQKLEKEKQTAPLEQRAQIEQELEKLGEEVEEITKQKTDIEARLAQTKQKLEFLGLFREIAKLLQANGYNPQEAGVGKKYYTDTIKRVIERHAQLAQKTGKHLVIGTSSIAPDILHKKLYGGKLYEYQSANPILDHRGLFKELDDTKHSYTNSSFKDILILDLGVIKSLVETYRSQPKGIDIDLGLNFFRSPKEIGRLIEVLEQNGFKQKDGSLIIGLGLNVFVPGNAIEIDRIVEEYGKVLSFIAMPDRREFASMTIAAEDNNPNAQLLTEDDVVFASSKAIKILATAAKKINIPFYADFTDKQARLRNIFNSPKVLIFALNLPLIKFFTGLKMKYLIITRSFRKRLRISFTTTTSKTNDLFNKIFLLVKNTESAYVDDITRARLNVIDAAKDYSYPNLYKIGNEEQIDEKLREASFQAMLERMVLDLIKEAVSITGLKSNLPEKTDTKRLNKVDYNILSDYASFVQKFFLYPEAFSPKAHITALSIASKLGELGYITLDDIETYEKRLSGLLVEGRTPPKIIETLMGIIRGKISGFRPTMSAPGAPVISREPPPYDTLRSVAGNQPGLFGWLVWNLGLKRAYEQATARKAEKMGITGSEVTIERFKAKVENEAFTTLNKWKDIKIALAGPINVFIRSGVSLFISARLINIFYSILKQAPPVSSMSYVAGVFCSIGIIITLVYTITSLLFGLANLNPFNTESRARRILSLFFPSLFPYEDKGAYYDATGAKLIDWENLQNCCYVKMSRLIETSDKSSKESIITLTKNAIKQIKIAVPEVPLVIAINTQDLSNKEVLGWQLEAINDFRKEAVMPEQKEVNFIFEVTEEEVLNKGITLLEQMGFVPGKTEGFKLGLNLKATAFDSNFIMRSQDKGITILVPTEEGISEKARIEFELLLQKALEIESSSNDKCKVWIPYESFRGELRTQQIDNNFNNLSKEYGIKNYDLTLLGPHPIELANLVPTQKQVARFKVEAEKIRFRRGIISPVLVLRVMGVPYVLIDGSHRVVAAKESGWKTYPAYIIIGKSFDSKIIQPVDCGLLKTAHAWGLKTLEDIEVVDLNGNKEKPDAVEFVDKAEILNILKSIKEDIEIERTIRFSHIQLLIEHLFDIKVTISDLVDIVDNVYKLLESENYYIRVFNNLGQVGKPDEIGFTLDQVIARLTREEGKYYINITEGLKDNFTNLAQVVFSVLAQTEDNSGIFKELGITEEKQDAFISLLEILFNSDDTINELISDRMIFIIDYAAKSIKVNPNYLKLLENLLRYQPYDLGNTLRKKVALKLAKVKSHGYLKSALLRMVKEDKTHRKENIRYLLDLWSINEFGTSNLYDETIASDKLATSNIVSYERIEDFIIPLSKEEVYREGTICKSTDGLWEVRTPDYIPDTIQIYHKDKDRMLLSGKASHDYREVSNHEKEVSEIRGTFSADSKKLCIVVDYNDKSKLVEIYKLNERGVNWGGVNWDLISTYKELEESVAIVNPQRRLVDLISGDVLNKENFGEKIKFFGTLSSENKFSQAVLSVLQTLAEPGVISKKTPGDTVGAYLQSIVNWVKPYKKKNDINRYSDIISEEYHSLPKGEIIRAFIRKFESEEEIRKKPEMNEMCEVLHNILNILHIKPTIKYSKKNIKNIKINVIPLGKQLGFHSMKSRIMRFLPELLFGRKLPIWEMSYIENGVLHINITEEFLRQADDYAILQILIHPILEKIYGYSYSEAVDAELLFSSPSAKAKGVSDLNLFIIKNLPTKYLYTLIKPHRKDKEGKFANEVIREITKRKWTEDRKFLRQVFNREIMYKLLQDKGITPHDYMTKKEYKAQVNTWIKEQPSGFLNLILPELSRDIRKLGLSNEILDKLTEYEEIIEKKIKLWDGISSITQEEVNLMIEGVRLKEIVGPENINNIIQAIKKSEGLSKKAEKVAWDLHKLDVRGLVLDAKAIYSVDEKGNFIPREGAGKIIRGVMGLKNTIPFLVSLEQDMPKDKLQKIVPYALVMDRGDIGITGEVIYDEKLADSILRAINKKHPVLSKDNTYLLLIASELTADVEELVQLAIDSIKRDGTIPQRVMLKLSGSADILFRTLGDVVPLDEKANEDIKDTEEGLIKT